MIHNHEVGGSSPPLATLKASALAGAFLFPHVRVNLLQNKNPMGKQKLRSKS